MLAEYSCWVVGLVGLGQVLGMLDCMAAIVIASSYGMASSNNTNIEFQPSARPKPRHASEQEGAKYCSSGMYNQIKLHMFTTLPYTPLVLSTIYTSGV